MYQLSVRAQGRLAEAVEFENVVVKAGKEGALVRVRDIGRVELGAESYSSRLRFAGVQASGIGITLLPTANALDTFRGVQDELERLREELPGRARGAASRSTTSASSASRSSRC